MDCSTLGFPDRYRLLELAQTHVLWVSDAIQPSHPLPSPSPPAFNLSQHQGLFPRNQFFASGGQSIGVLASAPVFPMNIQDWFPLGWTGWIPLLFKGLSRIFSNITVHCNVKKKKGGGRFWRDWTLSEEQFWVSVVWERRLTRIHAQEITG